MLLIWQFPVPLMVRTSFPQGTVFALLLFLIFTTDLNVDANHNFKASFADDTRMNMEISPVEDTEKLQTHKSTFLVGH